MASLIRDRAELDQKLEEAGEKLVVIDFYATWCGPCKLISPKLEELAQQYASQAAVFKVDVDICEDLANEYNITLMPTFVFLRNKNVVEVFSGSNTQKLVESLEKFINPENQTSENATPETAEAAAPKGDDTTDAKITNAETAAPAVGDQANVPTTTMTESPAVPVEDSSVSEPTTKKEGEKVKDAKVKDGGKKEAIAKATVPAPEKVPSAQTPNLKIPTGKELKLNKPEDGK